MTDKDLEELYRAGKADTHAAGLRAVFEAGRAAGREEAAPAPVVEDASAELRQGFYVLPGDDAPGAPIIAEHAAIPDEDAGRGFSAEEAAGAEAVKRGDGADA